MIGRIMIAVVCAGCFCSAARGGEIGERKPWLLTIRGTLTTGSQVFVNPEAPDQFQRSDFLEISNAFGYGDRIGGNVLIGTCGDGVVGARFGNEYSAAGLQGFDGHGVANHGGEISLEPGEQDAFDNGPQAGRACLRCAVLLSHDADL